MIPYFFIPASKIAQIPKIKSLGAKELIIDFEDSLTQEQQLKLQSVFEDLDNYTQYWYRVPMRNNFDQNINTDYLNHFIQNGINKIVLPKVKNKQELDYLLEGKSKEDLKIILLVEHPRLFLELELILQQNYEHLIFGLALGSHDLVTELNASYGSDILSYPRQKLKFLTSAYQKLSIDIASMSLSNKIDFDNEVKIGMNLGYDAKFIIHPQQYDWLIQLIKESPEYIWAKQIISTIPGGRLDSNQQPYKFNGQIIERPHLEKAFKIMEKYEQYEK